MSVNVLCARRGRRTVWDAALLEKEREGTQSAVFRERQRRRGRRRASGKIGRGHVRLERCGARRARRDGRCVRRLGAEYGRCGFGGRKRQAEEVLKEDEGKKGRWTMDGWGL